MVLFYSIRKNIHTARREWSVFDVVVNLSLCSSLSTAASIEAEPIYLKAGEVNYDNSSLWGGGNSAKILFLAL